MRELVWLDLCSGLGGASQPALDRGWRVIRVDIEAKFKPDIVADVRSLPLKPFPVDVLWASPPCRDFVVASMKYLLRNPRDPKTGRFFYAGNSPTLGEGVEPDCSIAQGALDAINEWQPTVGVIENVWSSRKWLTPILGPVRAMIPGHVFWGNIPCLLPQVGGHKNWKDWRSGKFADRSANRAKIPYEIGEAICRAVEQRVAA